MARKVRATTRAATVAKTGRAQSTRANPKPSPEKTQKTPANTQKAKTIRRPDRSPSIFEDSLQSTYLTLQYSQKQSTDTPDTMYNEMIKNDAVGSPDLFETESNEKIDVPIEVKPISVGVQCSPQTRDIGVGTDEVVFKDFGIQCKPHTRDIGVGPDEPFMYRSIQRRASTNLNEIVYESNESSNEPDSFSSEGSSMIGDSDLTYRSSSSDIFDDFDLLEEIEDYDDKNASIQDTHADHKMYDETKSTISDSPPRNQIYVNNKFHSPESLRIQLKKCSDKSKK